MAYLLCSEGDEERGGPFLSSAEDKEEGEQKGEREEGKGGRVSKGGRSLNPSFHLTSSMFSQSMGAKWALRMEVFLYVNL